MEDREDREDREDQSKERNINNSFDDTHKMRIREKILYSKSRSKASHELASLLAKFHLNSKLISR